MNIFNEIKVRNFLDTIRTLVLTHPELIINLILTKEETTYYSKLPSSFKLQELEDIQLVEVLYQKGYLAKSSCLLANYTKLIK